MLIARHLSENTLSLSIGFPFLLNRNGSSIDNRSLAGTCFLLNCRLGRVHIAEMLSDLCSSFRRMVETCRKHMNGVGATRSMETRKILLKLGTCTITSSVELRNSYHRWVPHIDVLFYQHD